MIVRSQRVDRDRWWILQFQRSAEKRFVESVGTTGALLRIDRRVGEGSHNAADRQDVVGPEVIERHVEVAQEFPGRVGEEVVGVSRSEMREEPSPELRLISHRQPEGPGHDEIARGVDGPSVRRRLSRRSRPRPGSRVGPPLGDRAEAQSA